MDHRLLSTYLNDHLAGATVGRDLARRAAGQNRDNPRYGPFLGKLAEEIDEDREALLDVMRTLEVGIDHAKQAAGWGLEKIGRLKPNGRLLGYSPLSRVVELEGLVIGVTGKLALWRSLRLLAPADPRLLASDFERLAECAEHQREGLERHRTQAVVEAMLGEDAVIPATA